MAANGKTAEARRQCSCSIDVLASLLDYKDYSKAETVLRMRQVRGGGEKMALFRETPFAKSTIDRLRRAQVEAEVRCFLSGPAFPRTLPATAVLASAPRQGRAKTVADTPSPQGRNRQGTAHGNAGNRTLAYRAGHADRAPRHL